VLLQQFAQSPPSSRSLNARPSSPTDSSSLDQISMRWFPYERSDEITTRPNPIQWVQKKNQTLSRIKYGGDTDRINDVEEVLESGGMG
jgi:hypothetical protein